MPLGATVTSLRKMGGTQDGLWVQLAQKTDSGGDMKARTRQE